MVITNPEGSRLTPSVVAFTKTGERLVGQIAKRHAVLNAENTIYSAKRFIGRRYEEIAEEAKRVPFKVVRVENGDAVFNLRGKVISPPEVSAHVLRKLKKSAEDVQEIEVAEDVVVDLVAEMDEDDEQEQKQEEKRASQASTKYFPGRAALSSAMRGPSRSNRIRSRCSQKIG